jgi:hypothetical protein
MPAAVTKSPSKPSRRASGERVTRPPISTNGRGYVLPWVHVSLPESAVNATFWAALAGAAIAGAVDPPLAVLIGAGVVVSRHRSPRGT